MSKFESCMFLIGCFASGLFAGIALVNIIECFIA